MTEHELRDPVVAGPWTPRLIESLAIYPSSRVTVDYLVYRTLADADGLAFGDLGCTCPGFRFPQLRGHPRPCKHIVKYVEDHQEVA